VTIYLPPQPSIASTFTRSLSFDPTSASHSFLSLTSLIAAATTILTLTACSENVPSAVRVEMLSQMRAFLQGQTSPGQSTATNPIAAGTSI